jgi:DNA-binding GntR family transcriptional regulator
MAERIGVAGTGRNPPPGGASALGPDIASPPHARVGDLESHIHRVVFDSVMAHRLPPGTKLPEAALCNLFGCSRSTVRKVLQRLAHDHIVQLRPNRGAIVAVPTPDETRELFEARRALETAIVRLATANATTPAVIELRAQLRRERDALPAAHQPDWVRLASAFHLQLSRLAGNAILERYLIETVSRCSLIVALHERPGHASCEHDEHERIVEHIAAGEAAEAAELMDKHLRELERRLTVTTPPAERSLVEMLGLRGWR